MHTLVTKSINKASEILISGEIVAFPTETVFGLGALINREDAIEKIYLAKGRAKDNPLIVHISNLSSLDSLVQEIKPNVQKLIDNFWPGPLTLIFKKNNSIGNFVTSGLSTVAIRFPKHKIAQELITQCKVPIAAPSANISGKPSSTKYQHVLEDFEGKIPCILEGKTVHGLESTVIDCTSEPFSLLRSGAIPFERIEQLVGLRKTTGRTNQPKSPGMKYRHYSPKAKVYIVSENSHLPEVSYETSAFIGLRDLETSKIFKKLICKDLDEYAENLFSFFRDCDRESIEFIYCERPEDLGIGKAINERLSKAAS
ncbi:MAG: L-threonylcarbamoyladenylate synthase [Candidatus Caenarcaniphilales bacterium]|nr:L-threonylcarbamoyladenylate synthase [Candidatus Caenarcaniphilales bacterium]